MVHLGIDIGGVRSRGTLRDALQLSFTLIGERVAAAPKELKASANGGQHVLTGAKATR
jgi:hypothetical protein